MVAPLLIVSSSGWAWTNRALCTARSCRIALSQHGGGLRVVAGVQVPGAAVLEGRLDVDAQPALVVAQHVGELLAAGAEPAARGRIGRARHVAGDDDPLPLALPARV